MTSKFKTKQQLSLSEPDILYLASYSELNLFACWPLDNGCCVAMQVTALVWEDFQMDLEWHT